MTEPDVTKIRLWTWVTHEDPGSTTGYRAHHGCGWKGAKLTTWFRANMSAETHALSCAKDIQRGSK